MDKRNSILIILTLILLIGGVVLFGVKKIGKEEVIDKKAEVQKEVENAQEEIKDEIEKVRNNQDLVWYEVPELGIKFKLSKQGEKALRYEQAYDWGNSIKSVMFFDSVNKEKNDGCGDIERVDGKHYDVCRVFYLFRMKNSYNEQSKNDTVGSGYFCGYNKVSLEISEKGRGLVLRDGQDIICLNGFDYEKYSKEYGIDLGSISLLEKK